jgi:hypothetical protein
MFVQHWQINDAYFWTGGMSVDMTVLFCLLYEVKEDMLLLFGWLTDAMAARCLFSSMVVGC